VPGAGHIVGANETYLAKPDGLTIGTFNTGLVYSQIVGFQGIRFDLAKYSWIGKASSETRVFIVGIRSPYKTFKDILDSKEPIKMAASGVGTAAYNDVLIVAAATGAPIKVIPGYAGREGEMAMMREEVVGQIGSYVGLTSFIKAKECRVLLQIAAKKHKDLQDVPLASDMNFSAKAKKILAVIDSVAELGRLTAGPPNIPAGRLQVLRDAYKKALTNPDLLKEAVRMDMDIDPGFGDEATKLVQAAINQPPDNMDILRKIIKIEN
jgi:tripartite-type tricarboxylate transporter receptor subunit TctC